MQRCCSPCANRGRDNARVGGRDMAEAGIKVLVYAVRGRVLLKYGGQLALLLGVLTLVPLGVAVFEANWSMVLRYALICAGLFGAGGLASRLPTAEHIQVNEALTITALAFIVPPFLMVWPMMAAKLSFSDALFESVSGITTTGLSILSSVESHSRNFLFLRSWMQWYGGLGFIVLSVALLLGHQAAARRLISPVDSSESIMATARSHARRSLIVYVSLTLLGLILVWPLCGNGFVALLHVLSAVSTGGFSMFDNNLAGLNSRAAAIVIMSVALLSAVSLAMYWQLFHGGWRQGLLRLVRDVETRSLLLACAITGLLLSLLDMLHGGNTPWYQGFMLGISAQTTTGFSTQSVATLDATSKLVMILAMLSGGSVGSSAGGFKLLRLLILFRAIQLMLRRTATPPHAVTDYFLGDQKLAADDVNRALVLIVLYIMIVFVSWLPFVFYGYDPLNALFEVVSACGTVGLSSGITRPELEPVLKGVLCFDMLAGRVEIIALLVVLYPPNWFGRREAMT